MLWPIWTKSPDEKVKGGAFLALARPARLDYSVQMTSFVRSFAILLSAIFVATTLAVAAAPLKAETSVTMAAMPMAADAQKCKTCDPHMDMAARCALACAPSIAGVLAGPVNYAAVLADFRFEMADTKAEGRAPPPAFTPPRTTTLI